MPTRARPPPRDTPAAEHNPDLGIMCELMEHHAAIVSQSAIAVGVRDRYAVGDHVVEWQAASAEIYVAVSQDFCQQSIGTAAPLLEMAEGSARKPINLIPRIAIPTYRAHRSHVLASCFLAYFSAQTLR